MPDKNTQNRVRFAPSPTGLLHVGGLRTALYNYLFARASQGAFVLRIEDTDRARFVPEAEQDILESLSWAGLSWDEGPIKSGAFGPYRQSERAAQYSDTANELVSRGKAYYAFDSPQELDELRESGADHSRKYDASTRLRMKNSLSMEEREWKHHLNSGQPYVVRLKVDPQETIEFSDLIRGDLRFDAAVVDDQVLIKSDGMPTYHLANIVDDHLMGITHVIRGEEWLPSTPKHILLYNALGWKAPIMAHLPLILSPKGGKLSKRSAEKMGIPVSVADYRSMGYEPEAVVNFLAFLGWNPGTEQELFSLDELVAEFNLADVGSSGMQFSMDKLNWYNQEWLKRLDIDELVHRVALYAEDDVPREYLRTVCELMRERVTLARDIPEKGSFFFEPPGSFDEKAVRKGWKENTSALMSDLAEILRKADFASADNLELSIGEFVKNNQIGFGKIMLPLRLALTGVSGGPSIYSIMTLLGKDEVMSRIDQARRILG